MSSITQIKPKRTPNAYMLFLNENRSQIKAGLIAVGIDANKAKFVAQFAGAKWREMSTEEKQPYIDEANTLKDEAQAQANRLNVEAEATALVNTTPEPVSIPPVVDTKKTNTEETLRFLYNDAVKRYSSHFSMLDELMEEVNNYIDADTKSQEKLADKQAEIDALQKRVQQLEEEKEEEEREEYSAILRLSPNATSEERKALHLLLKSKKLSIVFMQDDKEVDDLQLSL